VTHENNLLIYYSLLRPPVFTRITFCILLIINSLPPPTPKKYGKIISKLLSIRKKCVFLPFDLNKPQNREAKGQMSNTNNHFIMHKMSALHYYNTTTTSHQSDPATAALHAMQGIGQPRPNPFQQVRPTTGLPKAFSFRR